MSDKNDFEIFQFETSVEKDERSTENMFTCKSRIVAGRQVGVTKSGLMKEKSIFVSKHCKICLFYWGFTPISILFQLNHCNISHIHDPWVNKQVLGYKSKETKPAIPSCAQET